MNVLLETFILNIHIQEYLTPSHAHLPMHKIRFLTVLKGHCRVLLAKQLFICFGSQLKEVEAFPHSMKMHLPILASFPGSSPCEQFVAYLGVLQHYLRHIYNVCSIVIMRMHIASQTLPLY